MNQKRRNQIPQVNANSLGELKRANASLNEQYLKVNEILDYRKQEVQVLMQQLYTQVEDFRLNMHTELRREIEVAWDLSVRTLELERNGISWWRRIFSTFTINVSHVRERAELILDQLREKTSIEHKRAEKEMNDRIAEDNKRAAIKEQAAKEAEIARQAQMEALSKDGQAQEIENQLMEKQKVIDGGEPIVISTPGIYEPAPIDDYGQPIMQRPLTPEEVHEENYANRSPETNVI